MTTFRKAERKQIWLRMALLGPTGSGKTMTALLHAKRLAEKFNLTTAFIDTEKGSASKYADRFDFDVLELPSFEAEKYIDGIIDAGKAGYGVLVIDSLSHAWAGPGGILDYVDAAAKKMRNPNSYAAWRKGTPRHNELVDTMLSFPGHLIVTMRSKMSHVQEKDEKTGRMTVRKIGMQPVQRDDLEYEFDIVGDIDQDHTLVITKTRCSELADKVFIRPDAKLADIVISWIDGAAGGEAPETAEQKDPKRMTVIRLQKGESVVFINDEEGRDIQRKHLLSTTELFTLDKEQREEYGKWLVGSINEREKWITEMPSLEKTVYPVEKAVIAARNKHLGVAGLNEASWNKLRDYRDHILKKEKAV